MSRLAICVLLSFASCSNLMFADNLPNNPGSAPVNIEGPTLGGKQFWTDQLIFHDWRIQRNAWTKHYRLLDHENTRRAWGTYTHCSDRLEALKQQEKLPPMRGKAVVVLHGLVRSRQSMSGLCDYLAERGDYTLVNVSYASTRNRLDQHARSLARIIENLGPEITEINFVGHSLGNLVIRHYLGDQTDPRECKEVDPRIKRIVMLAPPNNGAQFAERFQDNKFFQVIWGKSGVEIAKEWPELEKRLATPQNDFGIIAGGDGENSGNNPLLRGDDDFVVRVEETRLPGARDFIVLPAFHTVIMDNQKTREYVLRFLRNGYFVSPEQRNPIPIR